MSEIFCVKCGKEHTTENYYCEYCGTNIEKIIKKYKERQLKRTQEESQPTKKYDPEEKDVSGIEFYQQIKKAEKHRRRYGDRKLKGEIYGASSYEDRKSWDDKPTVKKVLIFVTIGVLLVLIILIGYWFWNAWN